MAVSTALFVASGSAALASTFRGDAACRFACGNTFRTSFRTTSMVQVAPLSSMKRSTRVVGARATLSENSMATDIVAAAGELQFGNPTNEQLLQTYRPPHFSCPYPVHINPKFSSEVVKARTDAWLECLKVDSILSPELFKRIVDMDISQLVARTYSNAMEPELEWACKFYIMLWIWDDTFATTETGKSPETVDPYMLEVTLIHMWSFPDDPTLQTQMESFVSYLKGQDREEKIQYIESLLAEARTQPGTVYPKPATSVLCNLYLDVWKQLLRSGASAEFYLRYAGAFYLPCNGGIQESRHRKSKTIPSSIQEYILMRRESSAVPICLVVIDFIYHINTPDTWYFSPEVQTLVNAVNDVISWHNDIQSFKMEVLLEKEDVNIVHMLSVYRKVSFTEAAEITTQRIYDRISDIEKAAEVLQSITPPKYQRNLEIYLVVIRDFISGADDWHINCSRYQ